MRLKPILKCLKENIPNALINRSQSSFRGKHYCCSLQFPQRKPGELMDSSSRNSAHPWYDSFPKLHPKEGRREPQQGQQALTQS